MFEIQWLIAGLLGWWERLKKWLTTPPAPRVKNPAPGRQYPSSWPTRAQRNSAIAITMAQLAAEGRPIGLSEAWAADIAVYDRHDYYGIDMDVKGRLIANLPVRQRGEVGCG